MQYSRFDALITAKFGIVIHMWPINPFCRPHQLKVANDVEVLYQAWRTGQTKFCKQTPAERKEWLTAFHASHQAIAVEGAGSEDEEENPVPPFDAPFRFDNDIQDVGETAAVVAPAESTKKTSSRKRAAPSPDESADRPAKRTTATIGTNVNGDPMEVVKKARKPRCDKGTKKGPRPMKPATAARRAAASAGNDRAAAEAAIAGATAQAQGPAGQTFVLAF